MKITIKELYEKIMKKDNSKSMFGFILILISMTNKGNMNEEIDLDELEKQFPGIIKFLLEDED